MPKELDGAKLVGVYNFGLYDPILLKARLEGTKKYCIQDCINYGEEKVDEAWWRSSYVLLFVEKQHTTHAGRARMRKIDMFYFCLLTIFIV